MIEYHAQLKMTNVPLGAKVRRSYAPSRASSAMDEAVVPSALSTVACQPETLPVSSFAVRVVLSARKFTIIRLPPQAADL